MKIIIIGGVAAGTSAAAKARRNDENADIRIYEMDRDISYAGCGLPYYIGGFVKSREELVPRDASYFKEKYNVDVLIRHEVLSIDTANKSLTVKNLDSGEIFTDSYDKLVISTGARPIVPPIPGAGGANVFYLRNVGDADRIKSFIDTHKPASCLIVGTGFIGLEMAENLQNMGIQVTMAEKINQIMPVLDQDMSAHLEKYVLEKGVKLQLGRGVAALIDTRTEAVTDSMNEAVPTDTEQAMLVNQVGFDNGETVDTDFVIMSIGIRPNTALAQKAGIELGVAGAIKVDTKMQTNIPDIYACGDCAEHYSIVSKMAFYRPLGSTANKTGRITGEQITGGDLKFRGIVGTSIFKVFDMAVAQTGMTESEAIRNGYDVAVCHNIKPDRPAYFNGQDMIIKAIADKKDGRLLGVQILGLAGVDKRIDVFATAMTWGAKAEDLFHLDLAYSPPYSTTKDPVMYTGMILENILYKGRELITAQALENLENADDKVTIIDTRPNSQFEAGHVPSAVNIPQEKLRTAVDELSKDSVVVTYCNKGTTGNAAQNIMLNKGFIKTFNLSGGFTNFKAQKRSPKKD